MPFAAAVGRFLIRVRWPLVALYGVIVMLLIIAAINEGEAWGFIAIAVGLATQALFCFARGDIRLLRPVTFHRSWLPAGIGGGMVAVLAWGMCVAMAELFRVDNPGDAALWAVFAGSWLLWGIIFSMLIVGSDHLAALRRVVLMLIGGSLLQLTATVSAHMTVMRRGGCLVGIGTSLGMMCGASVLLWAFGPAVLLLFFYEARKRLRGHCPGCGYDIRGLPELRCPECGRPFTPREVGLTPEGIHRAPASE